MRNMARSICSVGMRSFIVCFDTGSPAKVTSTVDGRNKAIGEALRRTQGDWKEEGGMNPAPTSNCRDGRPHRVAPTLECRITEAVSRYAPTSDRTRSDCFAPLAMRIMARKCCTHALGTASVVCLGDCVRGVAPAQNGTEGNAL